MEWFPHSFYQVCVKNNKQHPHSKVQESLITFLFLEVKKERKKTETDGKQISKNLLIQEGIMMPVFYNSGKQVIWQESEIKNLGSLSNHVLFFKHEWKKHFSPLECLYPLHQHFACFQAHGWEYFKFITCFAKLNHLVKFNLVSKLLPILFRIQDGWRHYSLLGDEPGSAEANGAQECKLVQPESAEPPKNTYTCTAESLHAAKRKEKKILNGREIKQQHYKKWGGRDTIHK